MSTRDVSDKKIMNSFRGVLRVSPNDETTDGGLGDKYVVVSDSVGNDSTLCLSKDGIQFNGGEVQFNSVDGVCGSIKEGALGTSSFTLSASGDSGTYSFGISNSDGVKISSEGYCISDTKIEIKRTAGMELVIRGLGATSGKERKDLGNSVNLSYGIKYNLTDVPKRGETGRTKNGDYEDLVLCTTGASDNTNSALEWKNIKNLIHNEIHKWLDPIRRDSPPVGSIMFITCPSYEYCLGYLKSTNGMWDVCMGQSSTSYETKLSLTEGECKIQEYNPVNYPELANALGKKNKGFNLPDLRGMFIRCADEGSKYAVNTAGVGDKINFGQLKDKLKGAGDFFEVTDGSGDVRFPVITSGHGQSILGVKDKDSPELVGTGANASRFKNCTYNQEVGQDGKNLILQSTGGPRKYHGGETVHQYKIDLNPNSKGMTKTFLKKLGEINDGNGYIGGTSETYPQHAILIPIIKIRSLKATDIGYPES